MYSSSSSLLSVSGGTNSQPVAGSYAFQMTAYVSGAFTGLVSNDTSPEVTASNNTIQITVDGTQSGSVMFLLLIILLKQHLLLQFKLQ